MLVAWAIYPVLRLQYRSERQRQTLQQELVALEQRNAALRAEVEHLKTPEGVEALARERLGLTREGEQLYIVTDAESTSSPDAWVPSLARSIEPSTSVWIVILDSIFGVK